MRHWRIYVTLFAVTLALEAFGSPNHDHNNPNKVNRKDPAFLAGFNEGYRRGSNDSHALADAYNDEDTPEYHDATDGYIARYGDKAAYQQRFRVGYVDGYKAGWDFNAGTYSPLGGGPW